MKKCDRCGKPIEAGEDVVVIPFEPKRRKLTYCLCRACRIEFDWWMKRKNQK